MTTFWDIINLLTETPLVFVAIAGLTWGILGGALAGHLRLDHHGARLALHLHDGPGSSDRIARLRLYRRRVWRLDPGHSDQDARHQFLRRHGHRRL